MAGDRSSRVYHPFMHEATRWPFGNEVLMHSCRACRPNHVVHRRTFLADLGMGFTGLVLGTLLHRDGFASPPADRTPPDGKPHFAPKAKSVIWLFMNGGVSHVETFDPKPMLTKYAGKTIAETPFKDTQD